MVLRVEGCQVMDTMKSDLCEPVDPRPHATCLAGAGMSRGHFSQSGFVVAGVMRSGVRRASQTRVSAPSQ